MEISSFLHLNLLKGHGCKYTNLFRIGLKNRIKKQHFLRFIIRKSKCSTDFKRNDFLKKTKRTHWVRFVHLNSLIESCVFLYLWNSPFDTFL